jgi:transcriptional regulator with XRE-family HTH domain
MFIEMKERLLEFLKSENKSSAQLAEEIGVLPSGISHILSGRNNPSLDFVLKMLEKYHFLSTDWLLFGKGTMYRETKMQSLFDEVDAPDRKHYGEEQSRVTEIKQSVEKPAEKVHSDTGISPEGVKSKSSIVRIIMFYDDNSFSEYIPRG